MVKKINYLGALCLAAVCLAAVAGEIVERNGWTKESAARAAEERARDLAREKGTCEITRSRLSECKQEKDNSWTCYAAADNHGSSCR